MSDSENILPTSLIREGADLVIGWQNGETYRYSVKQLRDACPCATCREKGNSSEGETVQPTNVLPIISMEEARPLAIESMKPVGQYAYNIAFSDGHNSGLYTFDLLYELGTSN